MRILLLAPHPFFAPRGTPIAVLAVAKTLAGAGHAVDVLSYFEGEDVAIPNVRHFRIRRPPGVRRVPIGVSWQKVPCDAVMLRDATRLARRGRYDVAHAVEEAGFLALLLRNRLGLPFVFDMDSRMGEQIRARSPLFAPVAAAFDVLERATIRRAAGVVAVCPALADHARSRDPAGPVALLPDPPLRDVLPRPPGDAPSELARQVREVPGTRILYVGNLEHYQGVDLLVDAFARAAPELPEAHLFVAGGDAAGIARLRARVPVDAARRVHFLGATPLAELDDLLAAADILVSPRRSGTNTPMKIYGYMASGRPVLATRVAAHTQVLDGSTALLVPPAADALAEGLFALVRDAPLRASLARAALAAFHRSYGYDAYRHRLLAFYEEIEARLRRPSREPGEGRSQSMPLALH